MDILAEFFKSIFDLSKGDIIWGVLSYIIGLLTSYFITTWKDRRFRIFFGAKRKQDRIRVVYGQFTELVNPNDKENPVFANAQKKYRSGKPNTVNIRRFSEFTGSSTISAVNYISNELLKHKNFPSKVITDDKAIENFNNSFISIGGPASNELTDIIMNESDNIFYGFKIPPNPDVNSRFEIYKKTTEGIKILERLPEFDYGIILKLKNKHEHDNIKNCVCFVCAGLGSHGTSGASFYLANNWKKLYRKYKTNDFGILLKVRIGAVTDVSVIESIPENILIWNNKKCSR